MSANLYSPPKAQVLDQPRPPWSPIKAVFVGLVVDIGGTFLVSVVIAIVYAIVVNVSGMQPDQFGGSFASTGPTSPISILATILGGGMSVLGGFVCTRFAQRADYKLGAVMASLSTAFYLLVSFDRDSISMSVLFAALTFGSVMLGTRLGFVKRAS